MRNMRKIQDIDTFSYIFVHVYTVQPCPFYVLSLLSHDLSELFIVVFDSLVWATGFKLIGYKIASLGLGGPEEA